MKLKDILPYCLDYPKIPGGSYNQQYYWVLNGLTYQIEKIETYSSSVSFNDGCQYQYMPIEDSFTSILHLSRYRGFDTQSYTNDKNNDLTVNVDNEITIFDNFIIVHKTHSSTDYDGKLFHTHDYWVDSNTLCHTQYYVLGLMRQNGTVGCLMNNLRTVFKDLIDPPVLPKPAELTLDEKVDDLISSLIPEDKINEPVAWVVTSENGVERPTCITEQQAIAVANSLKYYRESLKVVPLYEHPPKTKDSRTMAIKKLKRMLNERL